MTAIIVYGEIALGFLVGLMLMRLVRPALLQRIVSRFAGGELHGWALAKALFQYSAAWPVLAVTFAMWVWARVIALKARLEYVWAASAKAGAEAQETALQKQGRMVAASAAYTD